MSRLAEQRGMSLLEVAISLALASVIILGVMGLWERAQVAYMDGAEAADAQQNLRIAMDRLTRVIWTAGQNPTAAPGFEAIGEAGDRCVRVRADLRGNTAVAGTDIPDGDTNDLDEDVKFQWDGASRLQQEAPPGAGMQDLALDIVANPGGVPMFQFFDASGTALASGGPCAMGTADRALVRLITVTLTARMTLQGQTVTKTLVTDIRPRNLS